MDDFKICNDTYGQLHGNMALKTWRTSRSDTASGSQGLLIRYGGDEFLLVLPNFRETFADQTETDLHRRANGIAASCLAFPYLMSMAGTDTVPRRPDGECGSPGRSADVSGKCRKNAVMVEVPGHNLAALEKLLQNKPQILLVDDSAMNRMMLTEILGDSYHILEAENGRECMEKLQAEAGNIALVFRWTSICALWMALKC